MRNRLRQMQPPHAARRVSPAAALIDPWSRITLPARVPDSTAGGHGLVGMRERASLLGGTFHAGPAHKAKTRGTSLKLFIRGGLAAMAIAVAALVLGGAGVGALHLRLLEAYAPPSLVVDERLQVVHVSGRAGDYLHVGQGEPSRGVIDLSRGALRMELRSALYDLPTEDRARRAGTYSAWLSQAVLPWVVEQTGGDQEVITAGVSLGAYHAVHLTLQRADVAPLAIGLSGNYDPSTWNGWSVIRPPALFRFCPI